MISLAIFLVVVGLFLCTAAINPTRCNKLSPYDKIEWLSKRYINKLKVVMSRVLTQEYHRFNL